jgi:hypothetical protein
VIHTNKILSENRFSVLIIAYGRPQNIQRILNSLKESGLSKVYISIDGPTNDNILNLQNEIIQVIQRNTSDTFEIVLRRQTSNLGVALGVITAVDWFFSQCQFGAIIEDDLVLSDSFVEFGKWAVKHVIEHPMCLFAGGFFLNKCAFTPDGPFFCKYPMIWGWVTTQEKWIIMRDLILSPKHFSFDILFSKQKQFWYVGAKRASLGIVDTWDIQLTYEFLRQGYTCLLSDRPLIQNEGFDELATHTKKRDRVLDVALESYSNLSEISINNEIEKLNLYYQFLEKNVYRITKLNLLTIYKYAFRRIFSRRSQKLILAERYMTLINDNMKKWE